MWHVSRWHNNSRLWTGCTCNNICSPVMSLMLLNGRILIMSLNPSKTKYNILTTRQKRQLLHSLSAHISVGNQQITEVSDHKVVGVTTDNNLTWGPPYSWSVQNYAQSAKIKRLLNFHAQKTKQNKKVFPSTRSVRYRLCFNSLGFSKSLLAKTFESIHKPAIKIVPLNELALPIKTTKRLKLSRYLLD